MFGFSDLVMYGLHFLVCIFSLLRNLRLISIINALLLLLNLFFYALLYAGFSRIFNLLCFAIIGIDLVFVAYN